MSFSWLVSKFVDCAEWFDADLVLSSFIKPLLSRCFRKISPAVYASESIADNTADHILRIFTLKHDPSGTVVLPYAFTWFK